MKLKVLILVIFILNFGSSVFSKEPSKFIKELTSDASTILASNSSKESKIENLKKIAENNVDINGIGLYSLGKYRKSINSDQKSTYNDLFKEYFLKSFSSRLVDYTDPEIKVLSEEKISDKYTMVRSILVATDKRPEVKLDWRVYTKNTSKPLIRDLVIEGLSLARTQKEEFSSIIISNDNNIEALFKNLREFIN
tara:strand:+ start:1705 stop:2289 length:585 start_codon:yes stop_codon:yes gene_type:complete